MLYVKNEETDQLASFASGDTVDITLADGVELIGEVLNSGQSVVERSDDGAIEQDYLDFLATPLVPETVSWHCHATCQ